MMFRKYFVVTLMILGFLVTVAQTTFAQNEGRIDRQIRKEILTLPYYNVFDAIGYERSGDTVTLNGYVTRPTTKKDAEESIADVDGVRRVVNNIVVLPLSPSDDRLRQRILQTLTSRGGSLYRYFMGANPSIRIIVNRGRVSLEGYVANRGDSNLANVLTRGVSGSFGVTNNLKIERDER
jgi:hyperosmotically inducible periplasmic protein